MRQTIDQLFVHPPAVGDVRVNDPIVFDGQVVVIVVIAMQDEHDGAADVVHREHGQIEEIAGHDHARTCRDDASQSTHDRMEILDGQRVLDRRLAVA